MIQEHISEVRLRVRSNAGEAAEIRPAAERMTRAVLEHCAALLEEKAPGRIVLIRQLTLNWRIDESDFADQANVEDLARAAAEAIERISRPPVLDPPATAEGAVIFDDEAHFRASHLLALARGRPAWFHAALESPASADPLTALASPERRDLAHGTLLRLARENALAEALAARPQSAVAVFAAALGCEDNGIRPTAADETHTAASQLAVIASRWPALTAPAFALAMRVHAAVLLDARIDSRATAALAVAAATLDASTAIDVKPLSPQEPLAEDAANDHAVMEHVPPAEVHRAVIHSSDPLEVEEAFADSVATRCAGLFYLCDRIMELDLAESLWKACLPEGGVLASAAAALLGPHFSDDPAAALFGGTTKFPNPRVTAAQHSEIAIATCAALAAALPRRGLAAIPPATVALVDHPTGRLLVATAENSPFAFFAWPASTPKMVSAGVDALLSAWPHHAVLTASPALATLDTSGRLRPTREPGRVLSLLPNAGSAPAAALLALVIGAPCLLFAARAGGEPFPSAEAFVNRFLALPGHIRAGPEQMEILFRGQDLDLAVRRAGLDRDPGWLPWLDRSVRLIFEGQEIAQAGQP